MWDHKEQNPNGFVHLSPLLKGHVTACDWRTHRSKVNSCQSAFASTKREEAALTLPPRHPPLINK